MRSFLNPDLSVEKGNMGNWYLPHNRRQSYHNLNSIYRYGLTFRSARVMALTPMEDKRIADLDLVRELTENKCFSALCVVREGKILFEKYARDFGPDHGHSIQSVTKTLINLMAGKLVGEGRLNLNSQILDYFPELREGYGGNTVQDALDMRVINDYSEKFDDPESLVYSHESSCGWRIPEDVDSHESTLEFLAKIGRTEKNPNREVVNYKSANSEVLALIIQKVGGIPLRNLLADIIDAAGIEGQFSISCDRFGFPTMSGGGHISARDLCRYGSIFTRGGTGVGGERLCQKEWIDSTLKRGARWESSNYEGLEEDRIYRYSNHTDTDGRAISHAGHCGQYLYADTKSKIVVAYFSVSADPFGICDYYPALWQMLQKVTRIDG